MLKQNILLLFLISILAIENIYAPGKSKKNAPQTVSRSATDDTDFNADTRAARPTTDAPGLKVRPPQDPSDVPTLEAGSDRSSRQIGTAVGNILSRKSSRQLNEEAKQAFDALPSEIKELSLDDAKIKIQHNALKRGELTQEEKNKIKILEKQQKKASDPSTRASFSLKIEGIHQTAANRAVLTPDEDRAIKVLSMMQTTSRLGTKKGRTKKSSRKASAKGTEGSTPPTSSLSTPKPDTEADETQTLERLAQPIEPLEDSAAAEKAFQDALRQHAIINEALERMRTTPTVTDSPEVPRTDRETAADTASTSPKSKKKRRPRRRDGIVDDDALKDYDAPDTKGAPTPTTSSATPSEEVERKATESSAGSDKDLLAKGRPLPDTTTPPSPADPVPENAKEKPEDGVASAASITSTDSADSTASTSPKSKKKWLPRRHIEDDGKQDTEERPAATTN